MAAGCNSLVNRHESGSAEPVGEPRFAMAAGKGQGSEGADTRVKGVRREVPDKGRM